MAKDPEKARQVWAADFDAYIAEVARGIGDGWTVEPESITSDSTSAFLTHVDGRTIGLRLLWNKRAVQTWAQPVPPRPLAPDATPQDQEEYNRVAAAGGVRYNAGATFTTEQPARTTTMAIRAHVLPVFDGKRRVLHAYGNHPTTEPQKPQQTVNDPDEPTNPAPEAQEHQDDETAAHAPADSVGVAAATGKKSGNPSRTKADARPRPTSNDQSATPGPATVEDGKPQRPTRKSSAKPADRPTRETTRKPAKTATARPPKPKNP
ncbi:hypothetical protein [Streptomyces luteireticuli]|uniref:hypothetical protein n=1 Tax=Streptomyces luteireticuli TaxID=173858 RepID=UPI0035563AF3